MMGMSCGLVRSFLSTHARSCLFGMGNGWVDGDLRGASLVVPVEGGCMAAAESLFFSGIGWGFPSGVGGDGLCVYPSKIQMMVLEWLRSVLTADGFDFSSLRCASVQLPCHTCSAAVQGAAEDYVVINYDYLAT